MKRTLWIAVLALMLPVAAWSDAIDLVYKFARSQSRTQALCPMALNSTVQPCNRKLPAMLWGRCPFQPERY